MATHFDERPSTVDRLLTREQIAEITVIEDLEAIQDEVLDAIKQIEVDLEFRVDDRADEDWEHRARKALAAHHVCNTRIGQRIRQIQRGHKPVPQGKDLDAKARKREAEAALLLAAAENKRAKAEQEREQTVRRLVAYADRQSYLASFYRIARDRLSAERFAEWTVAAREDLERTLLADLPAQVGRNPEGGDPQGLRAEHEHAVDGEAGDAPKPPSPSNPEIPNG